MIYNDGQYVVTSRFTVKSLVKEKIKYIKDKEYLCSLKDGVWCVTNELDGVDEYNSKNTNSTLSDFFHEFIVNENKVI